MILKIGFYLKLLLSKIHLKSRYCEKNFPEIFMVKKKVEK